MSHSQVEVTPGSYKVGGPSVDPEEAAVYASKQDSHFKLDETEWLTKEKGNTVISGLLVKIERI